MRTISALILISSVLLASNPALAEVPRSVIEHAKQETFSGRQAEVFYSIQYTGTSWELISVFSQPFDDTLFSSDFPKRWVMRRQAGEGDAISPGGRWADSNTCPQMEGVLWSLGRLVVPSFEVPGISVRRPKQGTNSFSIPVDGPVFSIWGQGIQPNGAPAFISLSGLGGELDLWGNLAERELANCWSDDVPTP